MPGFSQAWGWPLATLLLCVSGPLCAENLILQDVRHWTQGGVTRVAVQLNGSTEVRRDRLSNPERYFFDFQNTVPARRGMQTITVGNSLIRQIRIAEAKPGVARIVLDLVGKADVSTTELSNPYRLMIEVRTPGTAAAAEQVISAAPMPEQPKSSNAIRGFVPPSRRYPVIAVAILPPPPPVWMWSKLRPAALPKMARSTFPGYGPAPGPAPLATPVGASVRPAESARRGATGGNSLTRALGLKIRRVALDPGHGGHDQGSAGPTGLLEKDLVLDVALRLGELISSNLGSEVVYTRNDDHFVS